MEWPRAYESTSSHNSERKHKKKKKPKTRNGIGEDTLVIGFFLLSWRPEQMDDSDESMADMKRPLDEWSDGVTYCGCVKVESQVGCTVRASLGFKCAEVLEAFFCP